MSHGRPARGRVYGASISKDTISVITDRVVAELVDWQSRPLDAAHPVVVIDAIFVKIRDGQVANRSDDRTREADGCRR